MTKKHFHIYYLKKLTNVKLFCCLFLFSIISISNAQIARGIIGYLKENKVDSFYKNDTLNIYEIRKTTNFLTDINQTTFRKDTIPKRKKAFVRHIKHLSEKLEYDYFNQNTRNNLQEEFINELILLEASLKNKTKTNANPNLSFIKKVSMVLNTFTSKQRLKIKVPKKINPIDSIVESPYWHQPTPNKPIYKQFAFLAKQKNIKHRKNLVILFKNLSLSGSAPKINTYDLDLDNEWALKWGDEVHTDIVGSRIFAALGYDVDHPYYYEKEKLTLVFDDFSTVQNVEELITNLSSIYNIDLNPFLHNHGIITEAMCIENKKLIPFKGKRFAQFKKCAVEARPDRVKRIGSFIPDLNNNRTELSAALLAHQFIGNWDTREENTLLSTVHDGNRNYRTSAVFSDLGTGLGIHNSYLPPDFKVGLINKLPWEAVKKRKHKIIFTNSINATLSPYKNATYEELHWMAKRISLIDSKALKKIIKKAHWPDPISKLYFHKLASRRASILNAFNIDDPNPISFDKKLTIEKKGIKIIENGKLLINYKPNKNPESFYNKKGRLRNYGN